MIESKFIDDGIDFILESLSDERISKTDILHKFLRDFEYLRENQLSSFASSNIDHWIFQIPFKLVLVKLFPSVLINLLIPALFFLSFF